MQLNISDPAVMRLITRLQKEFGDLSVANFMLDEVGNGLNEEISQYKMHVTQLEETIKGLQNNNSILEQTNATLEQANAALQLQLNQTQSKQSNKSNNRHIEVKSSNKESFSEEFLRPKVLEHESNVDKRFEADSI